MKLIRLDGKWKVVIKNNNSILIVLLDEILFIEGMNAYSRIVLAHKKSIIVSLNLKSVEDIFSSCAFIRCHRRYLVNINCIKSIYSKGNSQIRVVTDLDIPASREGLKRVRKVIGL